jgi:membrane-bound lytic murein transglycosylase B
MTRPEILALCAACLPLLAMNDVDPQRTAAVDQMANACIADTTHPEHNSDLCRAYYQARFQQASPAPDITLQNGKQDSPEALVQQLLRQLPSTQSLDLGQKLTDQQLKALEQQLRSAEPSGVIIAVPPQTFGTGPGQIVR